MTPIKQDNQARITKIKQGKVVASRKKHPTLLKMAAQQARFMEEALQRFICVALSSWSAYNVLAHAQAASQRSQEANVTSVSMHKRN